jgi:hypothetical protein
VAERSPAPPKIPAGARRYQQVLAEDSGMKFGEWLRANSRRSQHA